MGLYSDRDQYQRRCAVSLTESWSHLVNRLNVTKCEPGWVCTVTESWSHLVNRLNVTKCEPGWVCTVTESWPRVVNRRKALCRVPYILLSSCANSNGERTQTHTAARESE